MAPRTPSQSLRRGLLASAVALGLGVVTTPSCSTPFDPPNKIQALRVLSVEIDALALDTEDVDGDGETDDTIPVGSYVQPGESVRLKMQYSDGRTDLGDREAIQITWIGGCFNPEGDSYFNCYEPLGRLFQQVAAGEVEATEFALQGQGLDTFELKIPEDLLESREEPAFGPKLATAFVFFAACAGELRPVEDPGVTGAGAFPLGGRARPRGGGGQGGALRHLGGGACPGRVGRDRRVHRVHDLRDRRHHPQRRRRARSRQRERRG